MNGALPHQPGILPITWFWVLALTIPIILAGGLAEKYGRDPSLPDSGSYRSSQSDMVIESSSWRNEGADYNQWRQPPPPRPNKWRSEPPPPAPTGSTGKSRELFPKYEPGDPAFYNHQTREQEGQVKVFEFGR